MKCFAEALIVSVISVLSTFSVTLSLKEITLECHSFVFDKATPIATQYTTLQVIANAGTFIVSWFVLRCMIIGVNLTSM